MLLKHGHGLKAVQLMADARRRFPNDEAIGRVADDVKSRHAARALKRIARLVRKSATQRLLGKACDLSCAAGNFRRARRYARQAERLFPDDWQTHLLLGKLHFHRFGKTQDENDQEAALLHLDEAYQVEPQNYDTLLLLGLMLARTRDLELAQEIAHALLDAYPNDPKGIQLLGNIERALREDSRAGPDLAAPARPADDETAEDAATIAESVIEQTQDIDGASGVFVFDAGCEFLNKAILAEDEFEFGSSNEAAQSMLRTCAKGASRIGIGDFESCRICGEGWQVLIRQSDQVGIVGFFDGYPHGEALEQEVDGVLQEARAL